MANIKWTDDQLDYLFNLVNGKEKTWEEITFDVNVRFGTSYTIGTTRAKYYNIKKKNPARINLRSENHKDKNLYNAVVNQNDRLKDDLKKERVKSQQIIDACVSSLAKIKFKPIKPPKVKHERKKHHNLEMHLLRSDAQVGEVVDPQLTSGLGYYNFDVYKKRVDTLLHKTVLFYDQDHKSLGLNKLVSPQLGDHVEGENIYRGQAFYIDKPLVDQVFDSLQYEVNKFWIPLANIFPEIELYCVYGNHGRTGAKGEYHIKTNWDYVYYKVLQSMMSFIAPNIKIYISESPIMLVQHGNYIFCYKHGDDVNSWNGIPYYGLDRSASRTTSMFNKIIHYNCVGHFHSPANLNNRTFINGTLVGGSNLSINKMGMTSIPSQKMFYFHPKHGINRESDLFVDEPVNLKMGKNGIYTPIS